MVGNIATMTKLVLSSGTSFPNTTQILRKLEAIYGNRLHGMQALAHQ